MFLLQQDRLGFMPMYKNKEIFRPINFNLALTVHVGQHLLELVINEINQTGCY
jgi:hypothetical protein